MEPFLVHILGCGSAKPTLKHNSSAQVIEIKGRCFMIDCGECAQVQMLKSKISFAKIEGIFISHLHGDHCFGLPGLISTFGLLGRTAPLHIYAHKELKPYLDLILQVFCNNDLGYELVFHVIGKDNEVVFETKSMFIKTIKLQHRIPCCGFIFSEKEGLRHIKRDMVDFYKVPISQINNIKNGQNYTTPEGDVIENSKLTSPPSPVRSYAYCSDTRYFKKLAQKIENVSIVYHEATYDESNIENAKKYFHSTAKQAAITAKQANAKQLVLGHFSARYKNENILLAEAKTEFNNTILSKEGLTISI